MKTTAKLLNELSNDLTLVKLNELTPNVWYKIINTYKTTNKYGGETVIATITRNDEKIKTFLPNRYYDYDLDNLEFRIIGNGTYRGNTYMKLEFNEE